MNIKEKIGQRILTARKAKQLTRKALAELTYDLKPSAINNWERGDRTPGPEEVKQLSEALDVSAAYLMCLTNQATDDPLKAIPGFGALVPLLNQNQAANYSSIIKEVDYTSEHSELTFVPLSQEISKFLSKQAFAIKMQDESMVPELKLNDILIVDTDKLSQPGQFVIASLTGGEVLVRRYKQTSASSSDSQFELLATNKHWADVKSDRQCKIIGTVCGLIRGIKQ